MVFINKIVSTRHSLSIWIISTISSRWWVSRNRGQWSQSRGKRSRLPSKYRDKARPYSPTSRKIRALISAIMPLVVPRFLRCFWVIQMINHRHEIEWDKLWLIPYRQQSRPRTEAKGDTTSDDQWRLKPPTVMARGRADMTAVHDITASTTASILPDEACSSSFNSVKITMAALIASPAIPSIAMITVKPNG